MAEMTIRLRIDPNTGKPTFDTDAYLAAVAALNASQGNTNLPVTGSSSTDFAVLGIAMIAVGSATVVAARRRRA